MIFRITQKLVEKLHVELNTEIPYGENSVGDWHAMLFRAGRIQYILLTSTSSLYSLIMLASGINGQRTFTEQVLSNMRDVMGEDGYSSFDACIAPHMNSVSFSKTGGRSILGSLNKLVFCATYYLARRQMSPRDTSLRLNGLPMKPLGFYTPREAFQQLMKQPLQRPDSSQEGTAESHARDFVGM